MRQAAAYVRWAYGHLSRSQRDAKEPAEYLAGRICKENSCHRIGVLSLKDFHRVPSYGTETVAPDGSPVFTHDTSYQEINALNIRWAARRHTSRT